MASDRPHLGSLDALRGFAVLFVFVYHAVVASYGTPFLSFPGLLPDLAQPPGGWTFFLVYPAALGWTGVAVFFVVSGFCIHLSYLRSEGKGWALFFKRRAWRILPPYYVALILFAFVWPTTRLHGFTTSLTWHQLVSHIFLLHNVDYELLFGINASFWTLAIEVQLYLIYPLLLVLTNRLGWRRTLVAIFILEMSLRATAVGMFWGQPFPFPLWVANGPFFYWGSWSLGAYLAQRFAMKQPLAIGAWWLWPLGALFLTAYHLKGCVFLTFPLAAAMTFVVLARSLFPPLKTAIPMQRSRVWVWVEGHLRFAGVCSYSLYLIHQPLLEFWVNSGRKRAHITSPLMLFVLALPVWFVVLGLSRPLYRFLERPVAAMGRPKVVSQDIRRAA